MGSVITIKGTTVLDENGNKVTRVHIEKKKPQTMWSRIIAFLKGLFK